MNLAERMKFIREKTGLTQQKFADELEIKINTIKDIESGRQKTASIEIAEKIIYKFDKFAFNELWILTGKGNPVEETPKSNEAQQHIAWLQKELDFTNEEVYLILEQMKSKKFAHILLAKVLATGDKESATLLKRLFPELKD